MKRLTKQRTLYKLFFLLMILLTTYNAVNAMKRLRDQQQQLHECIICNKQYIQRSSLNYHLKSKRHQQAIIYQNIINQKAGLFFAEMENQAILNEKTGFLSNFSSKQLEDDILQWIELPLNN